MSDKILKLDQAQTLYQDLRGRIDALPTNEDIPEVPVQDVQVNGTSILNNGVANVPVASTTEYGVVKVNSGYGISMRTSEPYVLTLYYASDGVVKGGANTSAVFSVSKQHLSAFYGLAKAAGHDEKNSAEPVGTYTPEAKGAIQKMLGVSDLIAPEENNLIASKAYKVGEVFTANGKLYKATAAIAQDAAIIPDTNCIETTVADESVRDVQVNGVSVLTDGVANVPIANSTNPGVMKVGTGATGVYISDSTLRIRPAYSDDIKNGSNSFFPVTPNYQHQSVFYGLSKVAGVDMSSSSNAVGTYTDGAKTAIRNMLGATSSNVIAVQDTQPTDSDTKIWLPETAETPVQIPTMEDLGDYVQKTDYATTDEYGLIKVGSGLYIGGSSGKLSVGYANSSSIKSATNANASAPVSLQHESTFYGLAKAAGDTTMASSSNEIGTYTAEAKTAIHTMLGIDPASIAAQVDIPLVETVSGTTPTITGQPNVRYVCGEVSTITITPPASGSVDVIFESGSTATTMTVPSTVKWPAWFDAEALETNTTYEVLITDGIYGSVMTWAT